MKHRGAAFYSRLVRNRHIRGITTYVLIAIDRLDQLCSQRRT